MTTVVIGTVAMTASVGATKPTSGTLSSGHATDTSALPAGGCTDSYTPVCLTDGQLQAEIQKDISALVGLPARRWSSSSSPQRPYADTAAAACDAGERPNGNDANATISVTSHERNETIAGMNGNAWYDRAGYDRPLGI